MCFPGPELVTGAKVLTIEMLSSTSEEIQDAIRELLEKKQVFTHFWVVPIEISSQIENARTFVKKIRCGGFSCEKLSHQQRFTPSQQVSLDPDYRLYENAKNGPLREGDIGIVTAELEDGSKVRCEHFWGSSLCYHRISSNPYFHSVRSILFNTEWTYENQALRPFQPSLTATTAKLIQSFYFPALTTMLFSMCERDNGFRAAVVAQSADFTRNMRPLELFESNDPAVDCVGRLSAVLALSSSNRTAILFSPNVAARAVLATGCAQRQRLRGGLGSRLGGAPRSSRRLPNAACLPCPSSLRASAPRPTVAPPYHRGTLQLGPGRGACTLPCIARRELHCWAGGAARGGGRNLPFCSVCGRSFNAGRPCNGRGAKRGPGERRKHRAHCRWRCRAGSTGPARCLHRRSAAECSGGFLQPRLGHPVPCLPRRPAAAAASHRVVRENAAC